MYASNADGTTQTSTDITGSYVWEGKFQLCSVVMTGTTSIDFYVSGTKVATHTTNIPTAGSAEYLAYFASAGDTNADWAVKHHTMSFDMA
jgi:hypothetical protein